MNKHEARTKVIRAVKAYKSFMDSQGEEDMLDVLFFLDEQQETISKLKEAITPSSDTKSYHIGEYSFEESRTLYSEEEDEEDYEYIEKFFIPWTSVKDIMKRIRKYSGVEIDGDV